MNHVVIQHDTLFHCRTVYVLSARESKSTIRLYLVLPWDHTAVPYAVGGSARSMKYVGNVCAAT